MSPKLKSFVQRWLINTLAVLVAAHLVSDIHYASGSEGVIALFVASLLLGILNSFVRPVLLVLSMVLSLPLVIGTFGLFIVVLLIGINTMLLYAVGHLLEGFQVDNWSAAFWGSLVISLISLVVNRLVGTNKPAKAAGQPPSQPRTKGPGGEGPVIDV